MDTLVLVAQQESGLARGRSDAYDVLSSCAETCAHLAAEREKEFQVMDKEAQRCRGTMLAPLTDGKKKK